MSTLGWINETLQWLCLFAVVVFIFGPTPTQPDDHDSNDPYDI